jgi:hypothetical protein
MLGREAALAVGLEEVPGWERRLFDWSQKEPSWKTLKVINGWEIPNGGVYGKIIYKWKVDESGPLPCFTTSAISKPNPGLSEILVSLNSNGLPTFGVSLIFTHGPKSYYQYEHKSPPSPH